MTSSLDNISAPSAVADDLDLGGLAPLHPSLPHIVMYTRPVCPNCDRLKRLFKAAKIPVVAIPITADDDVFRLFNVELHVGQTPIVLVHNTFQDPNYFSGFDSERARIVINAVFARLDVLQGSPEPFSIDRYLLDLAANLEPDERTLFIRPDVFAAMAANHLGHDGVQSARCTSPSLLSDSRSEVPALLH